MDLRNTFWKKREAFREALRFVLENQFVQISEEDLEAFMVVIGSGMGVECSGDTSDISFYELAEKTFVLQPEFQRKYHVEFYARFRDDIIVVLGGDSQNRVEFAQVFKTYSKYFKLKIESISMTSAVMLDLTLYKGKRFAASQVLDVAMFSKATAQGVPLCHSSWHQPSIHMSWPLSRCLHYFRCTTSRISYIHAVSMLISKIAVSSPGHPCLAALISQLTYGTLVQHGNGKRVSLGALPNVLELSYPIILA